MKKFNIEDKFVDDNFDYMSKLGKITKYDQLPHRAEIADGTFFMCRVGGTMYLYIKKDNRYYRVALSEVT